VRAAAQILRCAVLQDAAVKKMMLRSLQCSKRELSTKGL
jgi:hypothetical protein